MTHSKNSLLDIFLTVKLSETLATPKNNYRQHGIYERLADGSN